MKIAIVNRSFWPAPQVFGDALLCFAEKTSQEGHDVIVIMQNRGDFRARLSKECRGYSVRFYPFRAFTSSRSGILLRGLEAIFFKLWVIFVLLVTKPNRIYVSTDPPVIIPFFVMIYAGIFKVKYIYHMQDIHPEAANVVLKLNKPVFNILLLMDNMVVRNAWRIITITKQMACTIRLRSGTNRPIYLINNPAVSFRSCDQGQQKSLGFVFCGNAGRLQRIPLMLEAIETYFSKGGSLEFAFAGGGVYSDDLEQFSERFENFKYHGVITPNEAAQLNARYTWALLPIEDEVTNYAFPSKTSSYVVSGTSILAICGRKTSVAKWVYENKVGVVIEPNVNLIVKTFFDVENKVSSHTGDVQALAKLKSKLDIMDFADSLFKSITH